MAIIQLDDNGYFVGTTIADESPLEEGVFLLPRNCIQAILPNIPQGKRARWDGEWIIEDLPPVDPEPSPPPLPHEYDIKAAANKVITDRYPEWKQRNMLAEASYLDRNDPTNARIAELEGVWIWIQAVRSTSDQAEANGTAVADIVWPA